MCGLRNVWELREGMEEAEGHTSRPVGRVNTVKLFRGDVTFDGVEEGRRWSEV